MTTGPPPAPSSQAVGAIPLDRLLADQPLVLDVGANLDQVRKGRRVVFLDDDPTGTQTIAANHLTSYRVESSRLFKARMAAASIATSTWYAGDFRRAFAYMENWPITVTQAPENSEAEFNQDIVLRFKASERGAAAVIEPRAVVKSTAA